MLNLNRTGQFASVTGTAIDADLFYDVTYTASAVLVTVLHVPTHSLTVSKAGSGNGLVTSSPLGIDCGATCLANFNEGTGVTLSAAAAAGSGFTGWSGEGCSGTGDCQVTMDAARSVTATFDDTTAPAVTLTTPANGSSATDSTPTYSGNAGTAAGDLVPVTLKVYSRSGVNLANLVQTRTTDASAGHWSVDGSPALAPGTYTAQAEQSDSAGNTGASAPHTFTIAAPPVNHAPACSSGEMAGPHGTPVSIALACTDSDGGTLTLAIVAGPSHGTLGAIDQAARTLTYSPAADYAGADSLAFKANDGSTDSNIATVTLSVAAAAAPTPSPSPGLSAPTLTGLRSPGVVKVLLKKARPPVKLGAGKCDRACTVSIKLLAAGRSVGSASFAIAPGKSVALTVKLTKKAAKTLRQKRRLKVTAVVTVAGDGKSAETRRGYTLRAVGQVVAERGLSSSGHGREDRHLRSRSPVAGVRGGSPARARHLAR